MRILKRLPRETGREYALRVLEENIISLDLKPGTMLSENELAAQLSLSRTPVREALIQLGKVKIVEIYPQKGSVVSLVDYRQVEEARFMREVLECAVVELCCQERDPVWLEKLEENVNLQQFLLDHGRKEHLLELDDEFHRMLFQMVDKNQVYELMNSISIHFDRVRSMALQTIRDNKTVEDHKRILEAIRLGNGEEAGGLMKKHLSRYKVDEDQLRENYPGYFL